MTGSDEIAAQVKKELKKRYVDDTNCRTHRGLTERNWGVQKLLIWVFIGAFGAGATVAITTRGDIGALIERNIAQDKRLDDFAPLVVSMQQAALEMAFTVGEMKGMLAVQQQTK